MDKDLIRARMAANPYVPLQSSDAGLRKAHALDYIAFCLGEIKTHIETLAKDEVSSNLAAELDKLYKAIQGMAR